VHTVSYVGRGLGAWRQRPGRRRADDQEEDL